MHPTFGEEDKIHGEPMATPQTTKAKVSNFFYHYKWHTVIASFLVVVLVICSFQFCSRESYDIHIMYAGPKGLVSANIHAAATSLEGIARDYNGDGAVKVSFSSLYIDKRIGNDASDNIDAPILAQRSYENYETFVSEIQTGSFLILLLSPELFRELDVETGIFIPVSELFADVDPEACVGEGGTGITLSTLPIYKLPGLSALPADTVLCIRQPSAISEWYKNMFGKSDTDTVLGYHKEMFTQLLIHIPETEE